ncbi:MAG: hypothetical protein PHR77_14390 [Kiritimatiellae bacterium]|nr:hypothetical protein [Kiritimatiellia bacterium]MDD5520938.1 hypothetical protein [Kiritimatiellia bacterium]
MVVGSNTVQNLDLLSWAEEVVYKVERIIGMKLPYGDSRVIRIVVNDERSNSSGRVIAEERMENSELFQRLSVYNYDKVNGADANEALCKLLLNGYVTYCHAKKTELENTASRPVIANTNSVPQWLYRGISQYIYQDLRAKNTETILRIWKRGQLKPFPEFLNPVSKDNEYPYESVNGVMIAWLASLPESDKLFGKMFEQLSTGGTLSPEWFTKNIKDCNSVSDVDEKWENWIIGQWRVVRRLGVATPLQVEQLKERLVLQQGDVGMPLSTNISQRIIFQDLIGMKSSEWLPTVLQNKISELKLLGMGKGKDFNDVVYAYCKFLEAVAACKQHDYAKDLLDKAEMDLEILEMRVSADSLIGDGK